MFKGITPILEIKNGKEDGNRDYMGSIVPLLDEVCTSPKTCNIYFELQDMA